MTFLSNSMSAATILRMTAFARELLLRRLDEDLVAAVVAAALLLVSGVVHLLENGEGVVTSSPLDPGVAPISEGISFSECAPSFFSP